MSRPRNAAGQYQTGSKRSALLTIRCSQVELSRWKAAAGDDTISGLVRFLLSQWIEGASQRIDSGC